MIEIREYQKEALDKFKSNDWHGIFEMATGTGKTFTSLICAKEYLKVKKKLFLIIVVPFIHLVEQWEGSAELLQFVNFLKCNSGNSKWNYELESKIRDFNIGISELECVITTYDTASTLKFNELISKIKGNSFLIADECHYFGTRKFKNTKFSSMTCKLGLSATPDRWWDNIGTENLRSFFRDTVYEYTMEQAIDKGVLVNYNYIPIKCSLNNEELGEYKKYTKRIEVLILDKEKNKEELEIILRKRAMVVSKAQSKKDILINEFKKIKINKIEHTLVYCAPGEIDIITKMISDLGIRVHKFNSEIDMRDRPNILKRFQEKKIQVLVAIKCLDEGVDVPSTKRAYFLASTTNPREFIQRRGRILRKSEDKNLADVYDFIIIQNEVRGNEEFSLLKREMPRFAEFSRYAINKYSAREVLLPYLKFYNSEHLMDKLPWELYNEIQHENGGVNEN